MGKIRLFDRATAAFLGTLAAFGSMGVLASGMRFDEISVASLLLLFVIGSCATALLAGTRLFPAMPVLLAVGCIYLWWSGTLEPALEAFLHQMSKLYDMGYHWGLIRWTEIPIVQENASVVFSVLGLWIGLTVTWTAVRGRCAWLAVFVTFAPLVPCMILTDTVPSAVFLFVQLLCILLLVLSQLVRKRNLRQGGKLLVLLLLPVTLALGALFLLMPQEGYQGAAYAQKLEDFFLQLFQPSSVPDIPVTEPGIQTETSSRVHLTTVGPKAVRLTPVMTVSAEETRLLYLRGTAYDVYRGTSWDEDVVDYRFSFYSHGAAYTKITIVTDNVHDLLFVPYAPKTIIADGKVIADSVMGRIDNKEALREYTVNYSPVTDMDILNSTDPSVLIQDDVFFVGTTNPAIARYLQLPSTTKKDAQALLAREIPGLEAMQTQWEKTQAIMNYVRRSASYNLNTRAMPMDEEDFAMWFLRESETGYCVHFATAATVLLRAANIPARYVTGYMTWTRAGETVTVQQKNAHAWTEVYISGAGWVAVDATPPAGVNQTAGTEPTVPPEATEENPVTQATEPEETTTPEETVATTEHNETETTVPKNQDSTVPGHSAADNGSEDEPFVMPGWAKTLLWTAVGVGAVFGQWKTRTLLRKRRYTRGSSNARALAMWRDIERYARLLKTEPKEPFLELAWKARFSQYRLTKEELAQMEHGLGMLRKNMEHTSSWKKLYAKWILAL